MTYTTKIEKGFHGLSANTLINLNHTTPEGEMVLHITSMKRYSGNVSTSASVCHHKADGSYTTMVFQDYSKTIAQGKIARVTEKSLSEFHNKALEAIPNVLADVAKQYNLTIAA